MKQVATDRQVLALKAAEKPYESPVSGSRGLCVRVYPTGAKNFDFRYTTRAGARRRHLLGAYPDLSLADARLAAASLRLEVLNGGDPAGERAADKARARTGETMSELAAAYWKAATVGLHGGRRRPKSEATIRKEKTWWRNHVEERLGSKRFSEIRRSDVKAFMRELVLGSGLSPASIAEVGALVQALLGYAVNEDKLDANPAIGLTRPLALTPRDRLISDDVLSIILKAAWAASECRTQGACPEDPGARLGPAMGMAIRLLVLTLTRRSEVAGARWDEFDLNARLWTIPASRAKARHIHVVPLTGDMLDLLSSIRALNPDGAWLFPNSGPSGQHLDAHAITRAFARIISRHKLRHGSPHDVRRTGATTLVGRYGVSRLVVGMLLGHTAKEGAAVTSIYDRHSYIPEKRKALEHWSAHVATLMVCGHEARGLEAPT